MIFIEPTEICCIRNTPSSFVKAIRFVSAIDIFTPYKGSSDSFFTIPVKFPKSPTPNLISTFTIKSAFEPNGIETAGFHPVAVGT